MYMSKALQGVGKLFEIEEVSLVHLFSFVHVLLCLCWRERPPMHLLRRASCFLSGVA